MTKADLIQDAKDESTFSGALPYSLPDKEILRIVNNAIKYFYDNWRHALEPAYVLLPVDYFKSDFFKKANRTVTLPDCVRFVHEVQETNGGGSFLGTVDPDFGDQKIIGADIFLTPFVGEQLMYRTVMMSFLDLAKAFTLDTIAFSYNKNTHKISFLGHTPRKNVVVKVQKVIEEGDLVNDEMFQRYVRAKVKTRLSEQLTAFTFTLPGGVTINYTQIQQIAQDEWNKVLEDMHGEDIGSDFMFLIRQ